MSEQFAITMTPEQYAKQQLRDYLSEDPDHVVLRIGFSNSCSVDHIDLPFENPKSAHDAMWDINEGKIGRVAIKPVSGETMIWTNYATYCQIITHERWL